MDGEGTLGRGHGNGGRGLRRQRSLEWRERRGYGPSAQSSSDDEENSRHAVGAASVSSAGRGARSPGQVFASLLAQQYGSEWWYNWCLMPWSRGLRRPGEKFRGRRWPVSRATCLGEGTVFDGSYRGTYWAGGGGGIGNLSKGLRIFRVGTGEKYYRRGDWFCPSWNISSPCRLRPF